MKQEALTDETIARRVAGDTLADLRTVRREMRAPGSVRGLVGERVRETLSRYRLLSVTAIARDFAHASPPSP